MIKSLLNHDEPEEPDGNDGKAAPDTDSLEKSDLSEIPPDTSAVLEIGEAPEPDNVAVEPFEIPHPIGRPDSIAHEEPELDLERRISEIEDLIADEQTPPKPEAVETSETLRNQIESVIPISESAVKESPVEETKAKPENRSEPAETVAAFNPYADKDAEKEADEKVTVQAKDFVPEKETEVIRKSGLAYSAAIALFGSVVFMLIMGWFADLLLGITPWGTVIGITLGAIIGFIQFFRITAQITHPKPSDFERVSLKSNEISDLPQQSPADGVPIVDPQTAQAETLETETPQE